MSGGGKSSAKELLGKLVLKTKAAVQGLSELAVKAQEATNTDAWGPHGQLMTEIAEGSYDAEKFKEVWDVLRKRLAEPAGEKWRTTYKALLLVEFLLKQSSQHVVQVVLEHTGIFEELQKYAYKDENGKDWGINVRNRAKELCALLANPDRIREERAKARANKEKYRGLSKAELAGVGVGGDAGGAAGGYEAVDRQGSQLQGQGSIGGDRGGYEDSGRRLQSAQGGALVADEDEDEDPMAATARRIISLKQQGALSPAAKEAPAPASAPKPAPLAAVPTAVPSPSRPVTQPAAATGLDAFPAEPPVTAGAKPSLRALTEAKRGTPKKLGDVRVNPDIAAAFGGMKLAPPSPTKPAAAPGSPAAPKPAASSPAPAAFSTFGSAAGQAIAAAAPAPGPASTTVPQFDAFADFGGSSGPTSPTLPAHGQSAAAFDPFAALPGDRKPAASLADKVLAAAGASPAVATKPSLGGGNPFGAPTISLTVTAGAPLPEYMFTPSLFAAAATLQAPASPGGQGGLGSPVLKPSLMRGGLASPAATPAPLAAPAAAPQDDPFALFNPFKS